MTKSLHVFTFSLFLGGAVAHAGTALDLAVPEPGSRSGAGAPRPEWTVAASVPAVQELTWPAFLREVLSANLGYAAARYDVDIAAADAAAARLLPNPTLSLVGDRDLTYHDKVAIGTDGERTRLRQAESRSIGFGQTIELGGKRRWRGKVADESLRAAAATLDDFLRNLKLDATAAYVDALAAQQSVDRLRVAAGFSERLTAAQERRHEAGDIAGPDLSQARLEEVQLRNELMKAEAEAEAARYALSTFLGRDRGRTDFIVSGDLAQEPRDYVLASVIETALRQRPDLVALRHARDAADSGVQLAKAQRVPDVDVGLTYTRNSGVALDHPVDPTPSFSALELTLSFPLPLFDRGQFEVRKAHATADQAQLRVAEAELMAEVGIRTADAQYRSARRRLAAYESDILQAADRLLDARRIAYRHGASSLLELIEAQRSANELRRTYAETQADVAKSLIELERATGIDQRVAF